MIITVTLNPTIDRILSVPGFRVGRTLQGRVVAFVPAGKGVNVSRYLAAFGVPSVAAGFVGRREQEFYEDSLAGLPVTPAFVAVDAPTRVNTTIVSGRGRSETHLREEGFAVPAAKRAVLCRTLLGFARRDAVFVFSGSLSRGFSPGRFAELLRELRRTGAKVVVDTSGPALRAAVGAGVDLLSPNEDELREIARVRGTSAEAVAVAAGRLLRRVGVVAVKRGARGGVLVTRDGAFAAGATIPPSRVRNTVGAGDAFLAGFLVARAAGRPDDESLRSAVAAGAAAVVAGVVGTMAGPTFDRLLARAVVVSLPTRTGV